jgi:pyruvate/2-oxoacid:ferredoxin oxidoreductase alpha subunit
LDEVEKYEAFMTDDADIILVSIGLVSRSAKAAVEYLRERGIKVGLFRPITLWPFPGDKLAQLAQKAEYAFSCEMNEGQLAEIMRGYCGGAQIHAITQNDGRIMEMQTIVNKVREVAGNGQNPSRL